MNFKRYRSRPTGQVSSLWRKALKSPSTRYSKLKAAPKRYRQVKKTLRSVIKNKYVQQSFNICNQIRATVDIEGASFVLHWGESTLLADILQTVANLESFPNNDDFVDVGLDSIKVSYIPFPAPIHGTMQAAGVHAMRLGNIAPGARNQLATYAVGSIGETQFGKIRTSAKTLAMKFDFKAHARRYELNQRLPLDDFTRPAKLHEYLGTKVPEFIYGSFMNCADVGEASKGRTITVGIKRITVKLSFRGRK